METCFRQFLLFFYLILELPPSTDAAAQITDSEYIDNDGTLTALPTDIPNTVQTIIIRNSIIGFVDHIEPFPKLESLDLSEDSMTRFPNLANVSANLTVLILEDNQLNLHDEGIPHLPALKLLKLSGNALDRVPDLTNVSATLEQLFLDHNNIAAVEILLPMPFLQYVGLSYNQLTSFPNFTNTPTLNSVDVNGNKISSVEKLNKLSALRFLTMVNNQMTAFPDVSDATNLIYLHLYINMIVDVTWIPVLPTLSTLTLNYNYLASFPDLTNISASIQVLNFSYNNIAELKFVPEMPKLKSLFLDNNKLTEFPDLRNVSATLETLTIHGNDISFIDDYMLAPFSNLTLLTIGQGNSGDPLHMPNVCYMGTSKQLSLILHSENIVCDLSALFIKLAEKAGKVTIATESIIPKCVEPPELFGRNFLDLSVDDIMVSLNGTENIFEKRTLPVDWACPLTVEIVYDLDSVKCALLCLRSPHCVMFTTEDTDCILTSVKGVPDPSTFALYSEWFVMK